MPNLSKTSSDDETELSLCRFFHLPTAEDTGSSRDKGLADCKSFAVRLTAPAQPCFTLKARVARSHHIPVCWHQGQGMTGRHTPPFHQPSHALQKGQLYHWVSSSAVRASVPSLPKKTDASLLNLRLEEGKNSLAEILMCHSYSLVLEQHTTVIIPDWS